MLLEPRYLEKPWGGRRLAEAFGRPLPAGVPVGESWELFDRPEGSSRVRNGPLRDWPLSRVRGRREVPLLLKILDATGRLSLQVHPDEEAARADGTEPKTEAWVVLDARPGARVWRGLREGASPDDLRRALAGGGPEAAVEGCLRSFEPRRGDVVFVPAGVPHCLGGGVLVAEIQENSDTTYRLHDWGRGGAGKARPLQVEAGLRALRPHPPGPDRVPPEEIEDDGRARRLRLVACERFVAEHLWFTGAVTFETPRGGGERWHALLFLAGRGTVRAFRRGAAEAPFVPGDTVLLPAANEGYEIECTGAETVEALAFHEVPRGSSPAQA